MKAERISESRTRSLLLLDADPDERRLVSAIAGRAGWSVVGAADAAKPRSACSRARTGARSRPRCWAAGTRETGPDLIALAPLVPRKIADHRHCRRRVGRRSRSRRCAPEPAISSAARSSGAAARSAGRQFRPPPRSRRAGPGLREAGSRTVARATGRRRARLPRHPGGRRQGRAQPPADPDRRRARHRQGNLRPRHPRRQPARPRPAGDASIARRSPPTSSTANLFGHDEGRLPRRLRRQDRPDGRSRRRHAAARRDRRAADRNPGKCSTACSPPAKCARSAATAATRSTCGSSPPPAARCRTISTPGSPSGSAATSRQLAAAARPQRRHSRARPPLARRASPSSRACAPLSIGNDALAVLMRYGWPGNVRQLAGVLFRAGAAVRRQLADRRGFPAHRHPVALQRPAQRLRAGHQQVQERRCDGRRAQRHAVTATTAICGRWKRSRPTSSASPSAITAAA